MKCRSTSRALLPALVFCGFSGASPAWAIDIPEGTPITGTSSGAATALLGLDSGFTPGPGSNVTGLAAADLEFISDDFNVAVDFFPSGLIRVYDNSGLGLLAGSYSLSFDFAGLSSGLTSITLGDLSAVTGGTVSATWLNAHAVRLDLNNVAFTAAFDSFTAQLTSAVPEPASWALSLAGLAGLATLLASRRPSSRGQS